MATPVVAYYGSTILPYGEKRVFLVSGKLRIALSCAGDKKHKVNCEDGSKERQEIQFAILQSDILPRRFEYCAASLLGVNQLAE